MATANEALLSLTISHAIDLSRYSDNVVARMVAILNRSDAAMTAELLLKLADMDASTFSMERLEGMLYSVRSMNREAYAQLGRDLSAELLDFTAYELAFQNSMLVSVLPVQVAVVGVSVPQVYAAAMSRPFSGNLLKGFLDDMEAKKAKLIRATIADGYVQGKTTAAIVRSIRGTRAAGYADGVIEITRRDAQAVVRTALSHTEATARNEFHKSNQDVIDSVIWSSTLDSRTSSPCRIRDGRKYTLGAYKPIDHALPWGAGPGRYHWNSVVEGTLITTERGLIPIESVVIGDSVLTHKGRFQAVTSLRSKKCDSGVVRVVHTKSGGILRATDDHPVLTVFGGWKFVGALELGDEVFSDPKSLCEVGSINGKVSSKPENSPTVTDDQLVALKRTIKLVAANVNFKGDFDICAGEIEDSAADVMLSNPEWIKRDECAKHHFFAVSQILLKCGRDRLSKILSDLHCHWDSAPPVPIFDVCTAGDIGRSDLLVDPRHSGRVIGGHPFGVGCVSHGCELCLSESPVINPLGSGYSPGLKVNKNLLGLIPNRDVVLLSEVGEASIREAHVSLDSPQGVSGNDMVLCNDGGVVDFWFGHDVIIALEVQECNKYVYDLSVEGDCSYVASGIVVSNCRSKSVPVLKSWKELIGIDLPSFSQEQRASMDGAVAGDMDYATWIKAQSATRQDDILGKSRGDLLRQGGLSLPDLYSAKGVPLDLTQLRERHAAAFAKAGL